MTFLQPLILWGLPLVLLPVIIHLINRMRHRPRQWAAMQFLLAATRSSTSHAKLRNLLIMLMRVLAVLTLLLFLARPLVGGWLGWAVEVADIAVPEERLGRAAAQGSRHRPDGVELRWKQIGINGLMADPQLPFFIQWEVEPDLHPSAGADEALDLACLEIAGDPQRVSEWLGEPVEAPLEDVKVEWVAPHGTPGIIAVQVLTPNGLVRL